MARTYRAVADAVIARIRAGELPPHARVPLEELEREHGKAVTAAAVAWLSANRWVSRTPGAGVRVSGAPPDVAERPAPPGPPDLVARLDELAARLEQLAARVEALERRDGSLDG